MLSDSSIRGTFFGKTPQRNLVDGVVNFGANQLIYR